MFRLISWNVNGFRSILQKGLLEDIWNEDYDIICFQEVKLSDSEILRKAVPDQYHIYGNVTSNGRNGVLILTKKEASLVDYIIGHEKFDNEGRFIRVDFGRFSLINLYMPHGGRDKSKLAFKLEVAKILEKKLKQLLNTKVIIATDFNIARDDIDVCRAEKNNKNIMFTNEERLVISNICKMGYKDAFRELYPEKLEYTWWSYAFECRKRNIGWRIDYFFVTENFMEDVIKVDIMKEQMGSDHCPIIMEFKGK